MSRLTLQAAAWFAVAACGAAHAQMYKCVDERGRVTYSETLKPGCKGGAVDIRPSPPIGGQVREPEDMKQRETEFRQRLVEREQAEAKEAEQRKRQLAAKQERCLDLKERLLVLDSPRRIVTDVNAKGERTYMDDEARAKMIEQTKAQLRDCK